MMAGNKDPKISVILPVYNAELYLEEALESVLTQSFRDFEFIIINDGSNDRSAEIVKSFNDQRIIFINQNNRGLAATLNRGLEMARGEYIARQDNDDISLPQRFEQQVRFLEANPEIALVGTAAEIIDQNGMSTGRFLDHLTEPVRLKFFLLFNNPFVHSSVMFRRSVISETGNYCTDKEVFEDHNLWSRIARCAGVANIPARLLRYREVSSSMSRTTDDYMHRVKNQAVENVLYYCPSLDRKQVEECLAYILGMKEPAGYKKALHTIRLTLNDVARAFSEKEKIPLQMARSECMKQEISFKRHHYNSLILSENSNIFVKFKARILRKVMFLIYKRYFLE